jgi:hypothetical protein
VAAILIVVQPLAGQDSPQQPRPVVSYRAAPIENAAFLAALRKQLGPEAFSLILKVNRVDLDHVRQGDSLVVPEPTDPLALSPFPAAVSRELAPAHKLLVVSRRVQAFAAYEDGALVRWGPTSTGRKETPTPPGLYFTNWRSKLRRSTDNAQWMLPWLVNFENNRGISFHQFDLPGYPASHACVRLLEADARWMFDWAEEWFLSSDRRAVVAYGTPVVVFGEYQYGSTPPWKRLVEDPGAATVSPGELESALLVHAPLIAERARQRAAFLEATAQNRNRSPSLTTRPTENPSGLPTVSASSTAAAPFSATPLIR